MLKCLVYILWLRGKQRNRAKPHISVCKAIVSIVIETLFTTGLNLSIPTCMLNFTLKQIGSCIHQKCNDLSETTSDCSSSYESSGRLTIQALPAYMGALSIV